MSPARPAIVGGFVLGGMAIVVGTILFFGGRDVIAQKTKAVVFFEGSVGGLSPGAPVTFRGVRVGSVSKVTLVIDPKVMRARIPVYIELEPEHVELASGSTGQPMLRRLVQAGLRAKLEPESLVTGQMLVDLDFSPETPGSIESDTNPDLPEIPAIPSDLQELRQQLTHAPIAETISQAQRTLAAIEKIANRIDGAIGSLADSAQNVLDGAGRTEDSADAAIQRVQQDTAATLSEVRSLAADGRSQLGARGDELSRTLAESGRVLRTADTVLQSANSVVAPNSRSRGDLDATLRDLAASASSLRELSQTIERNPSAVLIGRNGR